MSNEDQFILLPRAGIRSVGGPAFDVLSSMPRVHSTEPSLSFGLDLTFGGSDAYAPPPSRMRIIDTASENGPKLVEIDRATAEALNSSNSPIRAVPVVEYRRPDIEPELLAAPLTGGPAGPTSATVTVVDADTGAGIPNATVIAWTNLALNQGAKAITDDTGAAHLVLATAQIERLGAYGPPTHWSVFRDNQPAAPTYAFMLKPIDLALEDAVRHYYGTSQFNPSSGVAVAVIDTGVGPHPLVNLVGGRNTVTGEPAGNYQDGAYHGTHVAGLVGADGSAPAGVRGLAPGVPIHSYRVFPVGKGATNYAILKALIFAADDGCDIVNLSLGGGPQEPIVEEAILDARTQGMLVLIAAGNDGRAPVGYPAAYPGATAVSAMGREGTFPPGTAVDLEVLRPPFSSADPLEFIARFSNVGPEIALTAPGVAVVSTLPGGGFGQLSGTSMAAPVAAGAAACLLSRDAVVYSMPRTVARADAIQQLLLKNCSKRGFGPNFEGYGLPDPAVV